MNISKVLGAIILGWALVGLPTQSFATPVTYNFDVTYDGVSQSLDAGSDPMTGTSLLPGDGFLLDLHTSGNDYWEVLTSNALSSIYASLWVSDSGDRTGNVITSFYLNNTLITKDIDNNTLQQFIHIGAQAFSLSIGQLFDQVIVDYSLISTTSTTTIIQTDNVYWSVSFLDSPNDVAYREGQQEVPVPEPTTLALFGIGLAGLGFARKKRKST